jgi:hypothetical protein
MTKRILTGFFIIAFLTANTQVAINTDGTHPNDRAILDVKSNTKGLLMPRMSSAQRKAIPVQSIDAGMLVFDIDRQALYMYDGQSWWPLNFSNEKNFPPVNRTPVDGGNSSRFGNSVAISGDYAIAGSPNATIGSKEFQGEAYIFYRTPEGWVQQAKLVAADGGVFHYFGQAVAIEGNYAAVSSTNSSAGCVYIFERSGNTWTQQAKIIAADGVGGDDFGCSVSLSGDRIIVGARLDDVGANTNQGSAYIYKRNGTIWTQEAKLAGISGAANDELGQSVCINGDYAIAGVVNDDVGLNANQGSAYVYVYGGGTWTLQTKLVYANGKADDKFGYNVSINQGFAIIGAPWADDPVNGQGAAYVFSRNGAAWSMDQKILASDPMPDDNFGYNLSVSNNHILIGTRSGDHLPLDDHGCAYLYSFNNGNASLIRKIHDVDGSKNDGFGGFVAMDGQRYIIGAPYKFGFRGSVSLGIID